MGEAMDFYNIRTKDNKGFLLAYPDWVVDNVDDLMVRGGEFYAVWDEERGIWSTNDYDVQRIVDKDLTKYVNAQAEKGMIIDPLLSRNFGTGTWESFNRYVRSLPDAGVYHQLDESLTFLDDKVTKKDYVSKRLPYNLEEGKTDAWDELLGTLYSESERDKIEWGIGAVFSGASKWIQKFLVFYGRPGTGKSTILGVIERLFEGYTGFFEAKALTSNNGTFALEPFESNPLVAIEHDSDLFRIETNTRLNSIVGHDHMLINAKYRSPFTIRPNSFLFIGTNKPVKITDAKSGIMRRLIDVHPTGAKLSPARYHVLVENVKFELGAIGYKCLKKFESMGKFYYDTYVPTKMMMLTDTFYNFIEAHFDIFKANEAIRLKQIWEMYKTYCEEMNIVKRLQYHEVRDELHSYFREFADRHWIEDREVRSVFVGFKGLPGEGPPPFVPDKSYVVELGDNNESAFDCAGRSFPAQYANSSGAPEGKWSGVHTTLDDLDTRRLHYVKIPENHIIIDFDLVDEDGEKDLERNIAAASKLPPTYAEVSKSGAGLHLHYNYSGDVHALSSVLDVGIEIKTLLGDASLRRQLTLCNNLDITTISGGLPRKEVKSMLDTKSIQTEKGLRALVERNLRKEIHPGTKPSIDFIHHILEEAYDGGITYDLSDLEPTIYAFAARSSNQATACLRTVQTMHFKSESELPEAEPGDDPIAFYDVEVYSNLFVVCWKYEGSPNVVKMINPKAADVESLFTQKLVGFNNRRYDNHILYAASLGYSNEELFEVSQNIVDNNSRAGTFGAAYDLSYADIYDFSSKKQGLKKFQIELGLFHVELDIPWDQPVPEEMWDKVVDYCCNDVVSTEATFNARKQDFIARQILAEISGLSVNHTTQQHTARIIFGDDKNPQRKFVYTDLSVEFPGYRFDGGVSSYHEEAPGEGGFVYSEPGSYQNVAVLDVASMHPTSIRALNLFGPYTERFTELTEARLAIKAKDYEKARRLLDGKLSAFIDGDLDGAEDLAYALKIVINSVYGLTSAKFPNIFKDNRNVDNIVAKRGALFMIDLMHACQDNGWQVIHIKTDSIKLPDATQEMIDFVIKFGKKYGYDFEHEVTYERFCLINDAVYIAREFIPGDHSTSDDERVWTAVGAQFQHPYVFKQLFSGEEIVFGDLCETRNVTKGRIYLDLVGDGDPSNMRHVGRTGSFMPVRYDGGTLWRIDGEKVHAVAGTKGYSWIDRDMAIQRDQDGELFTDMQYFEELKDEAIAAIEKFVPFKEFIA